MTTSSFFEVMLIILLRRSLFAAEFIRAFFQSSRWFKIYTKFRVESLWGEAINCSTLDQKLWQLCSPIPGAVSPSRALVMPQHSHLCSCCCLWAPAPCSPLPLPSLRPRWEGDCSTAFVPQLRSSSDYQEYFTVLSFIPLRALLSTLVS